MIETSNTINRKTAVYQLSSPRNPFAVSDLAKTDREYVAHYFVVNGLISIISFLTINSNSVASHSLYKSTIF